ncbi:hypothetical protein [Escherichia coli]|uniref:hypothetical protein n=1 Tax=Escherichia coli TaxID=562 RepID=UPI0006591018|nr:hypothetical protein [Escherichia coli]KLX63932.1 hypothetical protein SK79_01215 [Escherichia coli]
MKTPNHKKSDNDPRDKESQKHQADKNTNPQGQKPTKHHKEAQTIPQKTQNNQPEQGETRNHARPAEETPKTKTAKVEQKTSKEELDKKQ